MLMMSAGGLRHATFVVIAAASSLACAILDGGVSNQPAGAPYKRVYVDRWSIIDEVLETVLANGCGESTRREASPPTMPLVAGQRVRVVVHRFDIKDSGVFNDAERDARSDEYWCSRGDAVPSTLMLSSSCYVLMPEGEAVAGLISQVNLSGDVVTTSPPDDMGIVTGMNGYAVVCEAKTSGTVWRQASQCAFYPSGISGELVIEVVR